MAFPGNAEGCRNDLLMRPTAASKISSCCTNKMGSRGSKTYQGIDVTVTCRAFFGFPVAPLLISGQMLGLFELTGFFPVPRSIYQSDGQGSWSFPISQCRPTQRQAPSLSVVVAKEQRPQECSHA